MKLVKATKEHISRLVEISKEAFDSDVTVGASSKGGPPEYDSIEWHMEMAHQGNLFTAMDEDNVVGGILVFQDPKDESSMFVGRIFVDPNLFRKGYGIQIMEQIELMNPTITKWYLDTPVWNERTNRFYKKIGYTETNRDDKSVYYQKILGR